MHKSFSAGTEAKPGDLFEVVADLATYPEWLEVVNGAEVVERLPSDDGDAVWSVTLRARVGPLARSKRLRMCRTVHTTDDGRSEVRFERRETDGRRHSTWTMQAVVTPADAADGESGDGGSDRVPDDGPWSSRVELTLSYDGSMWSSLLDGLLDGAAEAATARLRRYVAERV